MTVYSYVRVSTLEQHDDRQLIAMGEQGILSENIFAEKQSCKDANRLQLKRLLATVKKGDTVAVESVSRFARHPHREIHAHRVWGRGGTRARLYPPAPG